MEIPDEAVEAAAKAMADLGEADNGESGWPDFARAALEAAGRYLMAQAHRIITTAEELVNLPQGAVILSEQGGIFQQFNGYWLEPANSYGHHLDEIALPATLLHEPRSAGAGE